MPLWTIIKDGWGKDSRLKVNGEGEIGVVIHDHPVTDETETSFFFRDYLRTSAGSSNMVVASETEFSIDADPEKEIFIESLHVVLADAGARYNLFGALAELTNGCVLEFQSNQFGTKVIHDGIKNILDFYRLSDQTPQIIDLSGGGQDAISVFINFNNTFGKRYGLRLKKGSEDRLVFRVRDNLTGVEEFNIIAMGIEVN